MTTQIGKQEMPAETDKVDQSELIKALGGMVNGENKVDKYTCAKCGNAKTKVSPFYGCLVRCPECGNKWQVY